MRILGTCTNSLLLVTADLGTRYWVLTLIVTGYLGSDPTAVRRAAVLLAAYYPESVGGEDKALLASIRAQEDCVRLLVMQAFKLPHMSPDAFDCFANRDGCSSSVKCVQCTCALCSCCSHCRAKCQCAWLWPPRGKWQLGYKFLGTHIRTIWEGQNVQNLVQFQFVYKINVTRSGILNP